MQAAKRQRAGGAGFLLSRLMRWSRKLVFVVLGFIVSVLVSALGAGDGVAAGCGAALDISLFPRQTRLDVEALNLTCTRPLSNRLGDELRAIVAADLFGLAVAFDRSAQDSNCISCSD